MCPTATCDLYILYIQYMTMQYESMSEARDHLKDVLDAAHAGRPVTVRRGASRSSVVDAERLRASLSSLLPSKAEVFSESGGWAVTLPGLPLAAEASSLEAALSDMIAALREYATDWADRLQHAPNHRDNWALVQLIELSDDAQLQAWLVGE